MDKENGDQIEYRGARESKYYRIKKPKHKPTEAKPKAKASAKAKAR